jgi:hypothetical protein
LLPFGLRGGGQVEVLPDDLHGPLDELSGPCVIALPLEQEGEIGQASDPSIFD